MEMEPYLPIEHDWPERLQAWFTATLGVPRTTERLAGMSLNSVWRVRFDDASVIVKAGPSAHEAHFYERVASSLRLASIPIPDLYHSFHEPERHWLLIEDIPRPLPIPSPDDWQPDDRIVTILARLHAATRARPPDLPAREPHRWRPEATSSALGFLQPDVATTLAPMLERLQRESESIDKPWCWISGDPKPRNWGLRADGTPVLFDWERFAPGVPAIDLAIVVPGLGTPTDYANVAAAYLDASEASLLWNIDSLARQIAVAKVATVVQLLHGHATGSAQVSNDLLRWLHANAPAWIRMIAAG